MFKVVLKMILCFDILKIEQQNFQLNEKHLQWMPWAVHTHALEVIAMLTLDVTKHFEVNLKQKDWNTHFFTLLFLYPNNLWKGFTFEKFSNRIISINFCAHDKPIEGSTNLTAHKKLKWIQSLHFYLNKNRNQVFFF